MTSCDWPRNGAKATCHSCLILRQVWHAGFAPGTGAKVALWVMSFERKFHIFAFVSRLQKSTKTVEQ